MKNLYLTFYFILFSFSLTAQTGFVTTWKTDNPGISEQNQVTIPTYASETYNYNVDWGDGTSDLGVTGEITHTYNTSGEYGVTITGQFPGISFGNSSDTDRQKLLEVGQWGSIEWKNFQGAFRGCENLQISATDTPDLSQVTSFRYAFSGCTSMIGHSSMNLWDMSNAVNLNAMFYAASSFNADIGDWDLANAEDITEMFRSASSFNQNIGNWRFPKVTSLAWMFDRATNFNGNISDWDVSNITAMVFTFENAKSFNQNISDWDTSNVTNMEYMFRYAWAFNQDISGWNVSNVMSMTGMFNNAISFDQDLGFWDIQSSISLSNMFNQVGLSTKNYDNILSGWASLPNLQTGIVFNAGLSQYCAGETSRQLLMDNFGWQIVDEGMSCPEPLSINEVLLIDALQDNVLYSLRENALINQNSLVNNLLNFEVVATDDVGSVHIELQDTQNTSKISNDAPYTLFGSNGTDYSGQELALGTYTLIATPYSGENLTGIAGTPYILHFKILNRVQQPFITTWKTDAPGSLLNNTIRIATLPGEHYYYDVDWGDGYISEGYSGSTNHTYSESGTYTIKISGNFPGIVFNGNNYGSKLISIDQWGDLDWVTMKDAFVGCTNLDILATDVPDLSNVKDMSRMFFNCSKLNGNDSIGNWDTGHVTDMNNMFKGAQSFNQNISNWQVTNVSNMASMFEGATVFDQDLGEWEVTNVSNMQNMFATSGFSNSNYEATLMGWGQLSSLQYNVKLGAQQNTYCISREAHEYLSENFGWIIHDGGLALNCAINGQMPFLTTWKTNNFGATNGNQITIYTDTRFVGSNYTVEWGDGTKDINVQGEIVHTYADPGIYRVAIYDHFLGMYFNNAGSMRVRDDDKILSIDQWGDIQWEAIHLAFAGCRYLDMKATDIPDLSKGPSLFGMFTECPSFIGNESISNWDVSLTNSIAYMFKNTVLFNQPLDKWDTGNVTNMEYMFDGASSFNQDVSNWNVSNVNHMMDMFNNSDFSDENYNKALSAWAQSPSLKRDVRLGAPQNQYCDAAMDRYDLIKDYGWIITDLGRSSGCTIYHPDEYFVTTWKTDNPGISTNNQITIPTYPGTFYNYIVDWGDGTSDSNVNGEITHTYAEPGTYQVAIAGVFPRIYFNELVLSGPIVNDSDKIISVDQWGAINWNSMELAFAGCKKLDVLATDTPDFENVFSMTGMFANCESLLGNESFAQWDVGNVYYMGSLFKNALLFDANIGYWDVSKVISMESVFDGAFSFSQNIGNWNMANVYNTQFMFRDASSFNQDIGAWNMSNLTVMNGMFMGATSFNQDIGNWNVSNVVMMAALFQGAISFDQDLSNWQVSNVNNLSSTFEGATSFDQNLESWNVGNVVNMAGMFKDTGLSLANYDKTLIGWSSLPSLRNNVVLDAGNSQYCDAEIARQSIMEIYGWNISDLGKSPNCNVDNDNDGVLDQYDYCLNTTQGVEVNANGCEILAYDAIQVSVFTPSCLGSSDGAIEVYMASSGYQLNISVEGNNYSNTFNGIVSGQSFTIPNLAVGQYSVVVYIPEIQYEQMYGVMVYELGSVSGKRTELDKKTGTASYIVYGSLQYKVTVNGEMQIFNFSNTLENTIQLSQLKGYTAVSITGINDCQGNITDSFYMNDGIMVYPTITTGDLNILSEVGKLNMEVYNMSGQLVEAFPNLEFTAGDEKLEINSLKSGIYLVRIFGMGKDETIKIIKK
ncbi:BspA family leucine-rich repeat surface protein [Allomuricauda taeanensis]|uniref:BspA family leucine-rich repeat surface protein n=1 Tax=Flagellimonas taeanensis TaxID=1005926 RepID=UPI002E7BC132|nr:BspA family leucine-rich repeat surface protein [Allomuricauda taeanensis]MEE1963451.1 BspA family leucine-rich repeat surface protein [Allomuricauda taeanensis]